jgi:flagellar motor switch protein FliN
MSADAPLLRLGESTAEAVERALQSVAPGAGRVGAVVAGHGSEQAADQAVQGLAMPAVCAEVSYVDGVTGGNVFLLPVEGARRLAATMMGQDGSDAAEGGELSELDLSAVGEAMNQMMSAAAMATAGVLGQEVEIAPPKIRVVTTEAEAAEMLRAFAAPHVLTTSFTVTDVTARLVQLVPNAFVVRMDRALDAQTTEYTSAPLGAALRAVPVRVWAELGRARMPAGTSLDLPTGSVVELDREVEDPVDLYVDGLHFASGRLRVAEDGSLQLEVETVHGLQNGAAVAELVAAPSPMAEDPVLADEPALAEEPAITEEPALADEPEVADAAIEPEEAAQAEPQSPTQNMEV